MMFSTRPLLADEALLVDFNSLSQDGGPHNQDGYQSFNARHEIAADFLAARSYSAFGTTVSLQVSWPDTTSNRVQQMIDRSPANDANWTGRKIDLLTDWIGSDTRTAEGGRGNYDGVTGLPTRMVFRFAGLPAGTYAYRSYHHDTENMHARFLVEILTDGGTNYEFLEGPFRITNSSPGGVPTATQRYTGAGNQDPATLPSTVNFNLVTAPGKDVLVRYTPLPDAAGLHVQFMVINGVELRAVTPPSAPTEISFSSSTVSRTAVEGSVVGQFATADPTPGDVFVYTLAEGEGSGDNADFSIQGDALVVERQLAEIEAGRTLSIRVRSTDAGGGWIERAFPLAVVTDSDGDGLDDEWELLHFGNLDQGPLDDPDADGLNNAAELAAGTSPHNSDTDGDGLSGGDEVHLYFTDPLNQDTDGDGLSDGDEILIYFTDPLNPDSDGDGYDDVTEIAEGTDPNNPASFPAFLLPLRINEFLASNNSGIRDGHGLREDWIELYNPNKQAVNLEGYRLTDKDSEPSKWVFPAQTIPASGYLLVFASGNDAPDPDGRHHTNFSLSASGEYLALIRPDGVIDHQFAPLFPTQYSDISYGRHPTDGSLRFFGTPTPGAANNSGFVGVVEPPVFSVGRGLYDDPFDLVLSCPTPGAEIRYTRDSSKPAASLGSIYNGAPLPVMTTSQIRASAHRPGWLSLPVETHSYVFVNDVARQPVNPPGWPADWGYSSDAGAVVPSDYEMDPRVVNNTLPGYSIREALLDLPSVSINLPMADFIEPPGGIYASPLNRVEKECSVEYLMPDGSPGFQANCKVEVHGNASRRPARMQKHSLRLTFASQIGPAKLKFPLFPDSPVETFNKLVLRACFTDSWGLVSWADARYRPNDSQYLRDVWMKRSFAAMGQPASHGRFVHLYVNGLYFGLHDLTERLEDHFFADHLGGEKEDWQVNADFATGSPRWTEMMAIANSSEIGTPAGYAAIKDFVDLENFADYMLLHFYADAEDWPTHNGYAAANPVSGDGKFRFFVWDQEIALDKFSWNRYNSNPGNLSAGRLFQRLRLNPEFRLLLADRVQRHFYGSGAISLEGSVSRYLRLADGIDKAIVAESARWGDVAAKTPYGSTVRQPSPLDNRDHDAYPPAPHADDPGGIYFTREDSWVIERDNIVNHHIPIIHSPTDSRGLIQELRANNLFPAIDAPVFSHPGGLLPPPETLAMSAPLGSIHFTTDGSDPRDSATNLPAAASAVYTSPFVIPVATIVKARTLLDNGTWSALMEAVYQPEPSIPEFLPGGSDLWALDANWSQPPFPNAQGAAAIVFAPSEGDRDIDIDQMITLGELSFEHGESPFRNRLRGRAPGHPMQFDAGSEAARIRVNGSGLGWAEFDLVSDIHLVSDLELEVNNPAGDPVFGALRLRGTWTGGGGLIKTGAGLASMTGDGKFFTGAVIVREGVLQVTQPAAPGFASVVGIEPGGQLRLSSGGLFEEPRIYGFGGNLVINSSGRSGVPAGSGFGVLGGLRYEPGGGENRAIVTDAVVFAGSSGIHVSGGDNHLELAGTLAGSSAWLKSGAGTLVIGGTSPGFTGPVLVQQGTLEITGSLGSSIDLAPAARLGGTGSLGDLSGSGTVQPAAGILRAKNVAAGLQGHFVFSPEGHATLAAESLAGSWASLQIFLAGPPPLPGSRLHGALILPPGSDWSPVLTGSATEVFVQDAAGSHAFAGVMWKRLDEVSLGTAAVSVDLGSGLIAMEILEIQVSGGLLNFAAWQTANFNAAELSDEAISGPAAAPFGDGIPNLLRYALGGTRDMPIQPLLPTLTRAGGGVVFRFPHDPNRSDLIYRIEVSTDPGDWSAAWLLFDSASDPLPARGEDGWLEIADPTPPAVRRFYRLQVIAN